MEKETFKNESENVFMFEQPGGEEKILAPGKTAKLERTDYVEGLLAQGYLSTKETREENAEAEEEAPAETDVEAENKTTKPRK